MSAKRAFFGIFQKIMVFCCAIFFGFANAFSANLPTGYTELEYIESTGTQSINTGVKGGAGLSVDMVVQGTGDRGIIFSFDQDYTGSCVGDNGTDFIGPGTFTGISSLVKTDITTYWESENSKLKQTTTINGVTKTSNVYSRTPGVIALFKGASWSEDNSFWAGKIFSFLLKSNGVAIRNFVPAKNSSGVIGMYDTVNNVFYTNQGTGTFTAGPVVRAPLPNEYQAITPDNTETYPETLSGYTLVKSSNSTNWAALGGVNGGTDYYRFDLGPGDIIASDTKRISNFGPQAGISQGNSVVGFSVYKSSSNQRNYISVRDPSKFTSVSALGTYFASNPLMVLYKNTTATNNEFVAVSRRSDNVFGYYCVSGTNQGDFVPAYGMTGSVAIKIATTAYNAARFSPVVNDLNSTVATIRDIVTNTINQTAAIASLQADKQTRPDEQCPAGKKCLLVETEENGVIVPHWFPIIEAPEDN